MWKYKRGCVCERASWVWVSATPSGQLPWGAGLLAGGSHGIRCKNQGTGTGWAERSPGTWTAPPNVGGNVRRPSSCFLETSERDTKPGGLKWPGPATPGQRGARKMQLQFPGVPDVLIHTPAPLQSSSFFNCRQEQAPPGTFVMRLGGGAERQFMHSACSKVLRSCLLHLLRHSMGPPPFLTAAIPTGHRTFFCSNWVILE